MDLPTAENPAALIHGDCLDVLRRLPDGCVDAVVTDPPYGLANTQARARPTVWQRRAGQAPREWDKLPADVSALIGLAGIVVVWGGNYFPLPPSRCWFAWVKPDAPPSMASMELAWTNLDRNAQRFQYSISATNRERVGHPTQKPLALMRWCLDAAGVPAGAVVFDPYMGSGTTGVACIQTGRRFIGCEIDATHYATARRRIDEALGVGGLFAPPAAPSPVPLYA